MLFPFNKIITAFVLTSFLTVVFFSFAVMIHGPDGRMSGNCLFSASSVSLCPQDTVAVAIHHLSAYHAFLNAPVGSGLTAIIISLLFVIGTFYVIFTHSPLLGLRAVVNVLGDPPLTTSHDRKITHWLSLKATAF